MDEVLEMGERLIGLAIAAAVVATAALLGVSLWESAQLMTLLGLSPRDVENEVFCLFFL